jgi:hypothetical protein
VPPVESVAYTVMLVCAVLAGLTALGIALFFLHDWRFGPIEEEILSLDQLLNRLEYKYNTIYALSILFHLFVFGVAICYAILQSAP